MGTFFTAAFLLLVFLAVYVLIGYPLVLAGLAARFGKPIHKSGTGGADPLIRSCSGGGGPPGPPVRLQPKADEGVGRGRGRPPHSVLESPASKTVSMLIAVYNGEAVIRPKLESVAALDYPKDLLEVLVLSDGSTDGTNEIVRGFAGQGMELIELPRGGKPAALNAGIARSKGEILVLTDARQTLEADSVSHLVACFADPTVGVASGDLHVLPGQGDEQGSTSLYWRIERWIRINLGCLDSTFGATGPFYAIRRELAPAMPPDTLLDDMFLPLHGFFLGFRCVVDEEAVAWEQGFSIKAEFRRKVRTLAGNYQILRQYPALLGPGNRMWFHFVSYKVGRLALPWILLALFGVSFGLSRPWNFWAVGAQAAFYLLALADLAIPSKTLLKRISSPARAFVNLMAAAALAVSVFFVAPQRLWKPTEASAAKDSARS
jgi:biofilm PGA synthesis N-glycosyltransferase PgaC